MNFPIIAVASSLGVGLWLLLGRRFPPGKGPLDEWPAALRASATQSTVKASSGRVYTVTSSRPGPDDKTLNAAKLRGADAWISYAHHRGTGKRELYRVWAPNGNAKLIAAMRKDFAV